MAFNEIKPTGTLRADTPQAGGANPRMVPLLAVVKDNQKEKQKH